MKKSILSWGKPLPIICASLLLSATIVTPITAIAIASSKWSSDVVIHGTENHSGISGVADSSDFQAVNNGNVNITDDGIWSVTATSGTLPSWISMSTSNKGQLDWTSDAVAGDYELAISYFKKDTNQNGSKQFHLTITNPAPTPTSINIYGANNLQGAINTAGAADFHAGDNAGTNITDTGTWSVAATSGALPSWISMSTTTKGQLVWTTAAAVGTYNLTIKCTKSGLTDGTKNVTLLISNVAPTPSSITIYGTSNLQGAINTAGTADFQAGDNAGTNITDTGTWSVAATSGTLPNWISMSTTTKGQLVWTTAAAVGTYNLTIKCTKNGLTDGTKNVTLLISNTAPTPSSITVYGTNNLQGPINTSGTADFQAGDNTGTDITNAGTWSVNATSGTLPSWISMSATTKGQLVWTTAAVVGTYNLTIKCTKSGLTDGTKNVTLLISNTAPTPSSITIYGTSNLQGATSTAGTADFQAGDNTGTNITNTGTWSVTATSGTLPNWISMSATTKGQLVWTTDAEVGTYSLTIKCTKNGLTDGTKNITLVIVSIPTTDMVPTYRNIKYEDESTSSIVLAQNETRDIIFNISGSATDLIYSYALTYDADNISVNFFETVNDPTYKQCGKLNVTATGTISSYGFVLMIYVFNTKTAAVGYTTYPLNVSVEQDPIVKGGI